MANGFRRKAGFILLRLPAGMKQEEHFFQQWFRGFGLNAIAHNLYVYIFIVMLCCAEVRQQPIVCVSIAGGCRALDVAYNPRLFCKEKRGAQDFAGESPHPNRALACP